PRPRHDQSGATRRAGCPSRPRLARLSSADCAISDWQSHSRHVSVPRICPGGRTHGLRAGSGRYVSPSGHLCGQDPKGRKTWGPARRATDQIRIGNQPKDRKGHWSDHPAVSAGASRRGHPMMDRRAFITVVGGSLLAAPLAAESQQPAKIPRLGYLVLAPLSEPPSPERAAFLSGLRELGWIEGKTIAIEYRSANWNTELLDDLGEELAQTKVDIIVAAGGSPLVRAAKQATSTIPIVMTGSGDPVAEGLVASMARPGGNVTGMSSMIPELGSKRLELLKETVPRVARLAVLLDPLATYNLDLPPT